MPTPESTPTWALGQPYTKVDLNPMPELTLRDKEFDLHTLDLLLYANIANTHGVIAV
jgi:hypothetical protein